MRTHRHREGNITHQGVSGDEGTRGGIARVGGLGGITLGEIPNVDNRTMDGANHHGVYYMYTM